ncbi:MAG: DUF881 domain-containing protein [Candidatus Nanopelagicales bacterium]|nr:DUF881 domain-containing protein [Candidatus Nanopelagicales bacterium]
MNERWWGLLAAAVFGVAGFLFAASSEIAAGTDLRSDTAALKDVVSERLAIVDQRQNTLTELQDRVKVLTREQEGTDAAKAQGAIDQLSAPAGLLPLTGPAVTVSLTDAPIEGNEEANPDDLVVHQQDLQAVINAMWRGGALGIQVMDQRLINTSAVRCVGNTLILQGRVYSPPFVVTGIGDQAAIERELERDDYLRGYLAAVEFFGLGYEQVRGAGVTIPGYDGPLNIDSATPIKEGR